jgi:hypothetical protein
MEKTFQAESGDIALYLYNVAMDEARQAANIARDQGNCRKRIKSNINNVTVGGHIWNQRK